MKKEPTIITGGIAVDDRGQLSYINGAMEGVKRFYIVSNHKSHFVRAWHSHKIEAKYVTVLQGSAVVAAIKIKDWACPDWNRTPKKYVLTANKPQLLYIPAGYANGFKTLTKDTKIMFFSTSTLEQSVGDDYRVDFDFFGRDFWEIKER